MMIDQYVGLPFAEDGRGPDRYDCWGLVKRVLEKEFGLAGLPNYLGVESVGDAIALAKSSRTWRASSSPRRGAVVVMLTDGVPEHVGVMVDDRNVLHVDRRMAAVCVPITHPSVAGRIESFWLHADLRSA